MIEQTQSYKSDIIFSNNSNNKNIKYIKLLFKKLKLDNEWHTLASVEAK